MHESHSTPLTFLPHLLPRLMSAIRVDTLGISRCLNQCITTIRHTAAPQPVRPCRAMQILCCSPSPHPNGPLNPSEPSNHSQANPIPLQTFASSVRSFRWFIRATSVHNAPSRSIGPGVSGASMKFTLLYPFTAPPIFNTDIFRRSIKGPSSPGFTM